MRRMQNLKSCQLSVLAALCFSAFPDVRSELSDGASAFLYYYGTFFFYAWNFGDQDEALDCLQRLSHLWKRSPSAPMRQSMQVIDEFVELAKRGNLPTRFERSDYDGRFNLLYYLTDPGFQAYMAAQNSRARSWHGARIAVRKSSFRCGLGVSAGLARARALRVCAFCREGEIQAIIGCDFVLLKNVPPSAALTQVLYNASSEDTVNALFKNVRQKKLILSNLNVSMHSFSRPT